MHVGGHGEIVHGGVGLGNRVIGEGKRQKGERKERERGRER